MLLLGYVSLFNSAFLAYVASKHFPLPKGKYGVRLPLHLAASLLALLGGLLFAQGLNPFTGGILAVLVWAFAASCWALLLPLSLKLLRYAR